MPPRSVKTARVPRVVFLSNVNAEYQEGTGIVLGLHDTEKRLNGLGIAEIGSPPPDRVHGEPSQRY